MELNVFSGPSNGSSGCGDCGSGGCGTCGTSAPPPAVEAVAKSSRRDFAKLAIAATAGFGMVRAARGQAVAPAGAPAAAAAGKMPEPVVLSPELNVVQKSKGPILT